MGAILAAVITLSGALILGYVSNFIAEDYKRFQNGSAVAASLSGELSSHWTAFPDIVKLLQHFIELASKEQKLNLRPFEPPNDPIFDALVQQFGLLGYDMVEDIVFTYQQIRAFRMVVKLLHSHHEEMTFIEIGLRANAALSAINRAKDRGLPLVEKLRARSQERYSIPRPWKSH